MIDVFDTLLALFVVATAALLWYEFRKARRSAEFLAEYLAAEECKGKSGGPYRSTTSSRKE